LIQEIVSIIVSVASSCNAATRIIIITSITAIPSPLTCLILLSLLSIVVVNVRIKATAILVTVDRIIYVN